MLGHHVRGDLQRRRQAAQHVLRRLGRQLLPGAQLGGRAHHRRGHLRGCQEPARHQHHRLGRQALPHGRRKVRGRGVAALLRQREVQAWPRLRGLGRQPLPGPRRVAHAHHRQDHLPELAGLAGHPLGRLERQEVPAKDPPLQRCRLGIDVRGPAGHVRRLGRRPLPGEGLHGRHDYGAGHLQKVQGEARHRLRGLGRPELPARGLVLQGYPGRGHLRALEECARHGVRRLGRPRLPGEGLRESHDPQADH
mmetsp:Transcript_31553/g.90573  ORF Transcript_31553/g.90573 Transcript_31553/m.90573 type:complete len:251 (+) Transcript_31553:776-1528(+)